MNAMPVEEPTSAADGAAVHFKKAEKLLTNSGAAQFAELKQALAMQAMAELACARYILQVMPSTSKVSPSKVSPSKVEEADCEREEEFAKIIQEYGIIMEKILEIDAPFTKAQELRKMSQGMKNYGGN